MSIEVLNESGVDVDTGMFLKLARFTMTRMRVHPEAELCVRLVDEDTMAQYNSQWMHKEGATDVLSFPMDELRPGRPGEVTPAGLLGDVVLCPEVAERQGAEAGHGTGAELELLCTHGVLHLLGYDHGDPEEHAEMFGLQDRLLAEWRQ